MHDVLAVVLAGGMGNRLSILASERAKPAVPFAGRYRIIDFTLSNSANSGIRRVAVVAQYAPRSLAQHLGEGRPWGLDFPGGRGFTLLQPYISRTSRDWYKGTADAILQNLRFIEEQKVKQVLVLGGDHVYTMRYDPMVAFHRHFKADITVGVIEVPLQEASRFGIVQTNGNNQMIGFEEKPAKPKSNLVSMGIYIFEKRVLTELLGEDWRKGAPIEDFGKDVLPAYMTRLKIMAYHYRGYWRDVGTVESYWQANMDLIVDLPPLNLYDQENPIRSSALCNPPVKFGDHSSTRKSLIPNGAIINGQTWNSVLSPHVYVDEGANISDSIVFDSTHIGRDAVIHRAIIDKEVWIGKGCHIGWGDDYTPNVDEPDNLNTGLTIIGKGARIPPGTKIGRNCMVRCWSRDSDFHSNFIASGSSVGTMESTEAQK
ncbi:MAG: glucose-1-phosphate adenylyltransferase [Chloroflexi bacterium]|nr:glucose-1-phosphate adenylyltransferase [Chloroflexota bacterium]